MKQTHMYVCTFEEFILVDNLDTLELNIEVKMHGKILVYILSRNKRLVIMRNVRIALRSQLTSES